MSSQTYSKDGTFSLNHKTCKCENNRGSKVGAELIYYKTQSLSQQGQLTIIDYLRSPIGRK